MVPMRKADLPYPFNISFTLLESSMIHAFGPPPTATVPEGDDEDEHVFVCVCSGIWRLLS